MTMKMATCILALLMVLSSPLTAQLNPIARIFPQVADGGGLSMMFVFINRADDRTEQVTLEFFNQDGTPMSVTIDGQTGNQFTISVPPRGVRSVNTSGAGSSIRVGWARATPLISIGGLAIFRIGTATRALSEAGVPAATPARRFTILQDSIGFSDMGIAAANPNAQEAILTLTLLDAQGRELLTQTLTLPALGQRALFLSEIFRAFLDILEHRGVVIITSDREVAITTLRTDNPDSSVLTTVPPLLETDFENPVPLIEEIQPRRPLVPGPFTIAIRGRNFTSASTVMLNGRTLSAQFVDQNNIIANVGTDDLGVIPPTPLAIPLTVTNPPPRGGTSTVDFNVLPNIVAIIPGLVNSGSPAFIMSVQGANFKNGATVFLGSQVLITSFTSPSVLAAFVPVQTVTGSFTLRVVNPDGEVSNSVTFTVQ